MVNGIRAVFFDLGKVLLHFSYEDILDRLTSRSEAMDLGSREALSDFLFDREHGLCNLYDAGRIGSAEFFGEMARRFDMGTDYDGFVPLWNGIFSENRAVVEVVRMVKRRLPVYLLSNINELHWEHIRDGYPIFGEMDGLVLSYLVGARKPEPAIYEAALSTAGVGRGESLFIDDLPQNIEAAKEHGIDGIVFTGPDDLKEKLAELEII